MPSGRTILYSALGPEMAFHDIDVDRAALTKIGAITLDEIIQYAWPNRARTILYVAMSGAGPMVQVKRPDHFVQAFRIERSGALAPLGPSIRLAHRPLHLSLDAAERHLLLCSNDPPVVSVHRLEDDGRIGAAVPQIPLDFGTTAHQVRVTPPGNIAIVPACGHHPTGAAPGSLRLFSYADGRLAPLAVIDADPARAAAWKGVRNGAQGFAVRHVDFHPTRRWMYLCLETQSEIRLYDYSESGVAPVPRFIKSTLEGVARGRARQAASAIHVHPNGRFVYVTNRAQGTEVFHGVDVFAGGVNDIAVFAIDAATGEPRLIQHADTYGFFPRTFGIDPSGRVLVVGNQDSGMIRDGDEARKVLPSLAVYRIGDDGRLTFVSKRDHPDNGEVCFWAGIEGVPG